MLSPLLFERDLMPDREGVGGGASPVAVGSGGSFESLDEKMLGGGLSPTSVTRRSGVLEALAGAFELGRIEGPGGCR